MPANESIPYKDAGSAITGKATAAITGKRFVAPSGNLTGGPGLSTDLANVPQVAHAGAGVAAIGVSKWDAASGSLVGIHSRPGMIVPVTAGGTIAAGARVQADATGQAVAWTTGVSLGVCLTGATNGADAPVQLFTC